MIEVDRLPTRDGKVNGVVKQKAPGGMAGNVAAALARLGSRVRVLGRVGDDADGAFAVKSLKQAGVDTSFVSRLDGVATFSCISLLTPDGEKSLVKLMTSAYRPDASDVTQAALEGVRHLHLTSVGDPALCRRVVEAARASGAQPRSTSSAPTARKTRPLCSRRSTASISSSAMRSCAPLWMRRLSGRSRASSPRSSPRSARTGLKSRPRRGASPRRALRQRLSTPPARATVSPPPVFMPASPQDWTGGTPSASPIARQPSQRRGSALSRPCRPPVKSRRFSRQRQPEFDPGAPGAAGWQ